MGRPRKTPPSTVIVSVRVPWAEHALLEAVRRKRGDESRTDTVLAALRSFLRDHTRPPPNTTGDQAENA
jgi:hypothetical protein